MKRYCSNCKRYVGSRRCPYCKTKTTKVSTKAELLLQLDNPKNKNKTYEQLRHEFELERVCEVLLGKKASYDPIRILSNLTLQTYDYNPKKHTLELSFNNHGEVIWRRLTYLDVDAKTFETFKAVPWAKKLDFFVKNIFTKFEWQ